MSEWNQTDRSRGGVLKALARSWQVPVLVIAVIGWVVFLVVGEGQDARQETVSQQSVKEKASACLKDRNYSEAARLVGAIVDEKDAESMAMAKETAAGLFETGSVEEGTKFVEKVLESVKDVEERVGIRVVEARGLRENGSGAQAEDVLRKAMAEYPQSAQMREAQFELGRALAGQQKYAEARKALLASIAMRPNDRATEYGARLLAAECLLGMGRTAEAEKEFGAIATGQSGSEEAVAARMRLARMYLDTGRGDEARSELSRLVGSLGEKGKLVNRYAQDSELRSMWSEVLQHYLEGSEFAEARELIQEGMKLGQKDVLLYSEGMTYEREAKSLESKAEQLEGQGLIHDAKKLREEAKGLKLRAAKRYLEIVNGSESARSRLFGKALWQAATCLYEGGDYARAAVYYGLFHGSADNDEQRARARLQHGRAMAALGNLKEANENFESVQAEYPGTLIALEAQYAEGMSQLGLGDLKEARKAFEGIVKNEEQLTPKAEVWKRSVPMLGYVCFLQGDYTTAATRLEESATRGLGISGDPRAGLGLGFYLAESVRLSPAATVEARQESLGRAAGLYAKFLGESEGWEGKDQTLGEMRRSARFARAGCLFEVGKYDEAAKAFREFSERYTGSEEAVTGLYRLATCYERLGMEKEARETRGQAQWSAGRVDKSREKRGEAVLANYWRTLAVYSEMTGSR